MSSRIRGAATHAARGLLVAALWTGCALRMDWPEHTITVEQRVELTPDIASLAVVVDQVELMPCAAEMAALLRPTIPSASAHGESGPTLLVPHLADAPGAAPTLIGQLTPPPGRFCSVRVLVRAGTSEAIGAAADRMRGASVAALVEGGEVRGSASAERSVMLDEPLVLGDVDATQGRLVLVWRVEAGALGAVDEDEVARGRALVAAVMAGLVAEVAR
jgi:hypothetical protein